MAVSLNSVVGFNSSRKLQANYENIPRSSVGVIIPRTLRFASLLQTSGSRRIRKERQSRVCLSLAGSNQIDTDTNEKNSITNSERSFSDDSTSVDNPPSFDSGLKNGSTSQTSDQVQEAKPSSNPQSTPRKSPLTARERLKAARVLSRYTEPKATKSEMGSKVLAALRESDRGKKRSGLPEAPTNMLDDSKRGMPKAGLTFDFPGGFDLFVIIFSFVFISSVMFATTYVVWKLGAIHFNEY